MKRITKLAPKFAYIVTLFTLMGMMAFTGLFLAVGPDLPAVDTIREIRLQTPMSVYSSDGQLMNEFGDNRRIPITLDDVPKDFIHALLSTEDQRFYEHSGVDFKGVLRAIFKLASTGTKSQGASTITMLVARNYYLTREKRFSRKFTEMFVAWKLENALSKDEILEIFLNKIPFGHRSAGLGAAAQVYYGKPLKELSLAQLATLAGIPKGQSVFNPISRPDKARDRRKHVLGRMLAEGYITQEQFDEANSAPIKTYRHGAKTTVSAPYVAEMVHQDIIRQFGRDAAHNDGLKITTTLNPQLQEYAQNALRNGLMDYDKRHGFRPVERHYDIDETTSQADQLTWISEFSQIGDLMPALVLSTEPERAQILLPSGEEALILLEGSRWAREYVDENHRKWGKINDIGKVIKPGDVVRILESSRKLPDTNPELVKTPSKEDSAQKGDVKDIASDAETPNKESNLIVETPKVMASYAWAQLPDVNGGLVVLNPQNGAVEALAGGFDFRKSQFNMVTQGRRQIGSNIKPFIYSSALNKGFTAASIINDSPIIKTDESAGNYWRPENSSKKYYGPTRLRKALALSINTVSIRLIQKIGPAYAKQYLEDIGFDGNNLQPFESLALGAADLTPMEVATAYATLANGGYKIEPWYIQRIEDNQGNLLYEATPIQVCEECIEAIEKKAREEQLALEANQDSNNATTGNSQLEKELQAELLSSEPNAKIGAETVSGIITGTGTDKNDATKPNDLLKTADNTTQQTDNDLVGDPSIDNLQTPPLPPEKIAPRVIEKRNHFIINDLLKGVIHKGTAWRRLFNTKSPLLKRHDIAGKTGTTNDAKDAWFSGYNKRYIASAWVGFYDHTKKLGNNEFGAKAALPIWQDFMEHALDGLPEENISRPQGLVEVKIDLENGKLASQSTTQADFEIFRSEYVPTEYSETKQEDVFDELDKRVVKQPDQLETETQEETQEDIF